MKTLLSLFAIMLMATPASAQYVLKLPPPIGFENMKEMEPPAPTKPYKPGLRFYSIDQLGGGTTRVWDMTTGRISIIQGNPNGNNTIVLPQEDDD